MGQTPCVLQLTEKIRALLDTTAQAQHDAGESLAQALTKTAKTRADCAI